MQARGRFFVFTPVQLYEFLFLYEHLLLLLVRL